MDHLGFEVLREAVDRIGAPLDAADLELLDRLRTLLEAELSPEACGKVLQLLERLRSVAGARHTLVIDPGASRRSRAPMESIARFSRSHTAGLSPVGWAGHY